MTIALSTLVYVPGRRHGRVFGNWGGNLVWVEIEKTGEHVQVREAELGARDEPENDEEGVAYG